MGSKAVFIKTSSVSGLYGDDVVIVKPDCHARIHTPWPSSLRITRPVWSYAMAYSSVWTLKSFMLGLAQTDNSLLRCHGKLGIYPRATHPNRTT